MRIDGASTIMPALRHGPATMRLFCVWVTFIHVAAGIPWTQEKVGPIQLHGFFSHYAVFDSAALIGSATGAKTQSEPQIV